MIVIRFWCLQRGPADINAADQSAVRLLCQDIVQRCLSLAAVGALEGVGHATFGGTNISLYKIIRLRLLPLCSGFGEPTWRFFFIALIADEPQRYHPACDH